VKCYSVVRGLERLLRGHAGRYDCGRSEDCNRQEKKSCSGNGGGRGEEEVAMGAGGWCVCAGEFHGTEG
jgi:hypothetical protein